MTTTDDLHANVLDAIADNDVQRECAATFAIMLDHLTYPQGRDGAVLDLRADVRALVAYHLTRMGWRWHPDAARIKPRSCAGPGTFDDARVYVSVDEPDDPLARLPDMSMREIDALPPATRVEALRRLGLAAPVEQHDGWTVQNTITITDEPDNGDDIDWSAS